MLHDEADLQEAPPEGRADVSANLAPLPIFPEPGEGVQGHDPGEEAAGVPRPAVFIHIFPRPPDSFCDFLAESQEPSRVILALDFEGGGRLLWVWQPRSMSAFPRACRCTVCILDQVPIQVIAMRNLKFPFSNVLACEIDDKMRHLASCVAEALDAPALYQPRDMAAREKLFDPLDLYVASCPCQSYSAAGNNLGVADGRGSLILECLARVLTETPKAGCLC